jgi:hypothetical protein
MGRDAATLGTTCTGAGLKTINIGLGTETPLGVEPLRGSAASSRTCMHQMAASALLIRD